jgi:hypothetical protein
MPNATDTSSIYSPNDAGHHCGRRMGRGKHNSMIDFSKAAVVMPFESSVTKASATLLPETTQKYVIAYLKQEALFSTVLTPEETKDKDKATLIEITGKLEDFAPGNHALPSLAVLGLTQAYTDFDIAIKDSATGNVLWKHRIKAVVYLATPPSELPEKVAKEFVKQLKYGIPKASPSLPTLIHRRYVKSQQTNPR